MHTIAEGYERKTNKEFKQFLFIAKESSGKIRSMLHPAYSLHYIPEDCYTAFRDDSAEISRILSGFIKKL